MTNKNTAEPPTSAAAANASRLRENQRRSRARKKEYLMSLESRFRACQQTGIEANVEIQNAAKKVVRENLLLRELLRLKGIPDPEVNKFVKNGGEGGSEGETAVEGVLKVLGRRPCGGTDADSLGPEPVQRECKTAAGERRNSTGMIAARDAGLGIGKPTVLTSTPVPEASPRPSPQLTSPSSSAHYSPTVPATPTATTTLAAFSISPPALAPAQNFYNFTSSPLPTSCVPFPPLAECMSTGNLNSPTPAPAPGPTSHPLNQVYGNIYPITTSCNASSCGTVCGTAPIGCNSASCSPTTSCSPTVSCGQAISPCSSSNSGYSYNYPPFPQSGYTSNDGGVASASRNSLFQQCTFAGECQNLVDDNFLPGMCGNTETASDAVLLGGVLDRV